MRADRLVATLLLLQARGRVTAAEVAAELEVSERTARRDLEALSMAGIPVYSQPGRGGGWSLLGGARTDLSGLTAAEARTLFLLAGPSAAATPEAKSALRKLVQALPETFRAEAEAAAGAVMLDPSTWGGTPVNPPPHVGDLQQAVVDGVQVELGYTDREGKVSTRAVSPLGLVQKGHVWYLVSHTPAGLRTFRVDRVSSLERTDRPVVRPEGFDLAQAWAEVVEAMGEMRPPAVLRGRVRPDLVPTLRRHWGTMLRVEGDEAGDGPPDAPAMLDGAAGEHPEAAPGDDGWVPFSLGGATWEAIVAQLAGYGPGLEVLDPPEARAHLARLGADLVARYG